MRRAFSIVGLILIELPLAAATRSAADQQAIDWLLSEVQRSDAVFLRNGKEYDGEKAAAHLKTKLWFMGKRVQTAREFIAGVASHSEESGKPYEIRFRDGTRQTLGNWLLDRLALFEKGKSGKRP